MRLLMFRLQIVIAIITLATVCTAQEQSPSGAPPNGDQRRGENIGMEGRRRPGVAGSITELNGQSMKVKTMSGPTVTVTLSDSTRYFKDRQPGKAADFKVGDMVMVRGENTGEDTWKADVVATRNGGGQEFREGLGKRFIVGEVKSIDGLKLTIARPDGVTQTIAVDESTSFRKNGESVTLADLHPGDHVMGRGEAKNGTFVPSTLVVGDPGMMPFGPSPQNGANNSH